jgi:hypothetical protein
VIFDVRRLKIFSEKYAFVSMFICARKIYTFEGVLKIGRRLQVLVTELLASRRSKDVGFNVAVIRALLLYAGGESGVLMEIRICIVNINHVKVCACIVQNALQTVGVGDSWGKRLGKDVSCGYVEGKLLNERIYPS